MTGAGWGPAGLRPADRAGRVAQRKAVDRVLAAPRAPLVLAAPRVAQAPSQARPAQQAEPLGSQQREGTEGLPQPGETVEPATEPGRRNHIA